MTKVSMNKLLDSQKNKLRPDPKLIKNTETFVLDLNKTLKTQKINARATLGGSIAKGTFLKNDYDADIFVRFNQSYREKNISDLLEKTLKVMKQKPTRLHGSRDYFQIKKEITYELVPVLEVKTYRDAETVVDMSPLHVDYFLKKAKQNKNLKVIQDEIRLTKQFLKSARIYGAESYINGFSGHVVDLLLIKYKTFKDLLKATTKWKEETIIDLEKYHLDPKMSLNASKIQGPLLIVDPVQKDRNAAAAVSKEAYEKFKEKAVEFLKNSDEKYFEIKPLEETITEKKKLLKADFLIINIKPQQGKKDVVGAKVLKIKEYIEQEIRKQDFVIVWSDWSFKENESTICIAVQKTKLDENKIIKGPPLKKEGVNMEKHVEQFKKQHKNTFTKNNVLYAKEKRKYMDVKKLLSDLIKDSYVKERCVDVKVE